ncbi:MFS transporter [Syntrophomonas erecta]
MKIDTKWQVLIIICIGIFMSTLDGSILNIANPTIAAALGVSMNSIQWIVTAYMLVITATLLFFGKLGDQIGAGRIYTTGFLIFAIGSLFCSLSINLIMLISARVFQALGASMMMATGIGIVSNTFPPAERGKTLGLTGSIVGIGNMTGPALGGFLVAYFKWPLIFLINIPLGLVGFLLACRYLPKADKSNDQTRFDVVGIFLFALAAIALILALSQNISLSLLLISLLSFTLFYFTEKRVSYPMLDFELFRVKNFVYGNIMGFATYCTQTAVFFLLPFFLEQVLNISPATSGILMTITPLTMAFTAPLAGNLSDKIGPSRLTTVSFGLQALAYLSFSTLNQNASFLAVGSALFLLGLGIGSFGSPNSSSILGSIPRSKAGYAGGFLATVRNFSFSLGVAASVAIFTLVFNINQPAGFTSAYVTAAQSVYRVTTVITLLGLILSITTARERKKSPDLA